MHSFSYLEPVCCSMFSSNCCFLTCIQISQETGQVVWYSHLFQNFPQFIVIHTVKGFGIVNKAEIDVFRALCFLMIQQMLDEISVQIGCRSTQVHTHLDLHTFRKITFPEFVISSEGWRGKSQLGSSENFPQVKLSRILPRGRLSGALTTSSVSAAPGDPAHPALLWSSLSSIQVIPVGNNTLSPH